MPIDTIRSLIERGNDFQIKFVVDAPDECSEVLEVVRQLHLAPADVWIMPQGCTADSMDAAQLWLMPWCEKFGFQYCDRMQIRWYGNRRGT